MSGEGGQSLCYNARAIARDVETDLVEGSSTGAREPHRHALARLHVPPNKPLPVRCLVRRRRLSLSVAACPKLLAIWRGDCDCACPVSSAPLCRWVALKRLMTLISATATLTALGRDVIVPEARVVLLSSHLLWRFPDRSHALYRICFAVWVTAMLTAS